MKWTLLLFVNNGSYPRCPYMENPKLKQHEILVKTRYKELYNTAGRKCKLVKLLRKDFNNV